MPSRCCTHCASMSTELLQTERSQLLEPPVYHIEAAGIGWSAISMRVVRGGGSNAPCCRGAAKPKPSFWPEAWVMESCEAVSAHLHHRRVPTSEEQYLLIQRSLPRRWSAWAHARDSPEGSHHDSSGVRADANPASLADLSRPKMRDGGPVVA